MENKNQPPSFTSNHAMDVHVQAAVPGSNPVPAAAPQPPRTHSEPPKKDLPNPPSQKSHAPKLAIVLAVAVALGLAAMAIVIYLQNRSQPKQEQQTEISEQPQPASTKDVDDTSKAVDEALKETDAAEALPEDDLNNQTLGL